MSGRIRLDIQSNFPIFMSADPDEFGRVFAEMPSDDQVQVLRAMTSHMAAHPIQWDYIAIELERPENSDVLNRLRQIVAEATP